MTCLRIWIVAVICACSAAVVPSPEPSVSPGIPSGSALASPTSGTTPVPPPSETPAAGPISAPSATIVWVLVSMSRLFVSTDRGTTWDERTVPYVVVANANISFLDASEGWLSVAGSPATGCMAQYIEVWHTADGALSWERTYASERPDIGCSGPISFVDPNTGFRSSSRRDAAPFVYRTTDGGHTWTPQPALADPSDAPMVSGGSAMSIGPVRAFGSMLFVSGRSFVRGTAKLSIFRSSDGGGTWSYAASAPDGGPYVILASSSRWLVQVVNAWSETRDAGATWHRFPTNYVQAAGVAPFVEFADAGVGYLTIRGYLYRTTDGGANWTFLRTP